MDAIETLMNEHRQIERVLDALAAFAKSVAEGGGDDRDELARFVTFLREFADDIHHGKEEEILFAAMGEHGFPTKAGPVAVMLYEHDQGRRLIRILGDRAAKAEPWTEAERDEIAQTSHAYVSLLRMHIQKEDQILYPMAKTRLPASVMDDVARRCDEHDDGCKAEIARFRWLAEQLVANHIGQGTKAHHHASP